ncbi:MULTISPECIES: putative 2OG-Fe(II) oxygenase [unclassified Novosphingobium]|uniref:putative 2OG-Fe(II) oxygenase n=1 Tax=unclassified Novosphingobium TaxID=2644732 RepID=UPI000ED5EBBF|nr:MULTISPECIES: putative 2OG-Fe(II) oxygenase [unclassified Novosphingobium]HCF25120.1 hypothetical protein [Novosphingobium sp.]HQV02259.1 putative 2OG-Fe(II) oxygenase [Novosphingobium sp.]
MEVLVPPALAVAAVTRLEVLRSAITRQPQSAMLKEQLAALLFDRDLFEEAAAILGDSTTGVSGRELLLLARILLARNAASDAERSEALAAQAVAIAETPGQREQAMLARARALLRLGRDDQGLDLLRQIITANPNQHGAFRTFTDRLLHLGQGAAVIDLADQMVLAGASHPRWLGARMLGQARMGDHQVARELSGIDLVHTTTLPTPAGWPDLDAFNAALQTEAEADPDLREGRHGTSSRGTMRVDHPQRAGSPAFDVLHRRIAGEVARRVAELEVIDHPWVAARPERLVMRSWCVMTEADGYEEWHNHPAGWMSGGYYIAVPDLGAGSEDRAGSLAFGVPPRLAGAEAAASFGETIVPPFAGMLALFPSHAYHRTYPHGQQGRRICMAFDLEPG